ncbi:hypothetical protein ACFYO1_03605 [Nocardia sp. NPDC006044]|uniref:hypothetical protein n=1 Tax=Nocardia sp. NPDC006044 TaxID=3364306 RepID=UPI00367B502F
MNHDILAKFHTGLLAGPLNRCVQFGRVPFARPVWSPSAGGNPVRVSTYSLQETEIMGWVDAACAVYLDVIGGHGWELAAAEVNGGTSVVSLVCSHALTDGHGLMAAVVLAARSEHRAGLGVAGRPSIAADMADAMRGGIREHARLIRMQARANRAARSAGGDDLARMPCERKRVPDLMRSTVAVQVGTESIERIATKHGGTPTGLMLAITANVARRTSGEVDALSVAVPVSFRVPNDMESSNVMAIATVDLDAQCGRYTDLADLRQRSRIAYTRVSAGDSGLIHTGAGFSSVGVFPAEARMAFGPALGVIGRAISDSGLRHGHVFAFAIWGDGTTSLWFQATGTHLYRSAINDELEDWGLDVVRWW